MNSAMALEHQRIGPTKLGELITFLGLPSKRAARELPGTTEDLFRGMAAILDGLLIRAIDSRTAAGFLAAREKVFGDYFRVVDALSNLVRVVVPAQTIQRLVWDSFSESEATFREDGLARFGQVANDQAIFTIWTLRKTSRLASQIAEFGPVTEPLQADDNRLASEFAFYAGWTQFHLDCLSASIRFDRPIPPDALVEICDGLRSAVNAYGLIRQGLDLRAPRAQEPLLPPSDWDEEDQDLLDSSMRDFDVQEIV